MTMTVEIASHIYHSIDLSYHIAIISHLDHSALSYHMFHTKKILCVPDFQRNSQHGCTQLYIFIHSDAFTAHNDIYHYDDIYYACVHESISL